MSKLLQQLDGELSALLEKVSRGLVKITQGRTGVGGGTVVHADGLILTNAHVIRAGTPKVVLTDGRTLPVNVLAYDTRLDLAALAVEARDLPAVEMDHSDMVRPGTLVFALGHPWGVAGAVSAGSVIGVGPPPELPGRNPFIQSDLQLRPGHSGGPMVNTQGRLVGINTMINGPEVGLAIPVQVIKNFLQHSLGSSLSSYTENRMITEYLLSPSASAYRLGQAQATLAELVEANDPESK